MKITGKIINFYSDVFRPALKNVFNFKNIKLERQPATDMLEINLPANTPGIKSNTFKTLLLPQFTPKTNMAKNGMKITTIIDKKTNKPVEAFVAMVDEGEPLREIYYIMVKDKKGDIDINNEKFRVVGNTYFYINKEKNMITPKIEPTFVEGELYEKVFSHMEAIGNKEYSGIGTRLHQLRVERMLQTGMGNVCIVSDGTSLPFHHSLGFRIKSVFRPISEAFDVTKQLSALNRKEPRENSKYVAVELKDGKQVINLSRTFENCLNEHYKKGGERFLDFSPNMYLDQTSLAQWVEMIEKQPILF